MNLGLSPNKLARYKCKVQLVEGLPEPLCESQVAPLTNLAAAVPCARRVRMCAPLVAETMCLGWLQPDIVPILLPLPTVHRYGWL
jgi:hypothetical protein